MKDGGCLADLKIVLGTLFVERDRLREVGISTSVVLGLGPECLIAQLDPITDSAYPVELASSQNRADCWPPRPGVLTFTG